MVKPLSTMRETQVQSLGREDPLEKEMAIHSSTIAWKIPRTEEPGRLQSMGSQRVGHNWATSLSLSAFLSFYLGLKNSLKLWTFFQIVGIDYIDIFRRKIHQWYIKEEHWRKNQKTHNLFQDLDLTNRYKNHLYRSKTSISWFIKMKVM